jgi:hypothetical protein
VNLDTSAIVGATQLSNPWVTAAIHAYLFDKEPVATQTAVKEFIAGTAFMKAGPTERVLAGLFLMSVTVIPDNPSARVMNLQVGSSKRAAKRLGPLDKIIFGTGDQLGIPTVTHDEKFVRAAAKQGVLLNVVVFDPVAYSGL